MQTFAIVVSLAITAVAVVIVAIAVRQLPGVLRRGQPALARSDAKGARTVTMLKETVLHTRMLQWTWIGVMHWFVFAAFIFLSTAVLAAYFQLFQPDFAWPIIGHWYPYEWFSELIGLLSTIGIVVLIVYRQVKHPRRLGRDSRFFGSTQWQAYFVEFLALFEGSAILFVRAAEWRLDEEAGRSHYPLSSWLGDVLYPAAPGSLENIIYGVALFKITLAMVWLTIVASNLTMGIAWHRFTAWPNIWFKREATGRTALGAVKPLTAAGKPVTLDDIEEMDEDTVLGAGSITDFSWKGILDFTTCTECGRCQSQCPAWNTEKPLSPKLLMMGLREEAYAHAAAPAGTQPKPLVGKTDADAAAGAGAEVTDWFYNPADGDFVIDEDVLWSCTSCGACVQQCPVDIEHVDHIVDMRRYQVLVESNFPAELNGLFKGLENKGNPWNMSPSARLDWAKDLPFEVKVVGDSIESLDEVDWLFWVGCAGAYEDRAKKTTRAVAELLDMAGVSFGVLGNGETCTGDPARRAGNEFVFQGLAQQNAETFKEYKVKQVVSTCAHCYNTLKNEYREFGVELEVVHHTQLLNRLVREGKLTPVRDGAGAHQRTITYHDPCYIGRHNGVYSPPRELLQVLPGAKYAEMERSAERSFCCGAGGARMWMEETLGERINVNRTKEAVGTGADQIAVGCPFCRVMLSDGLTAQQAKGEAREEVEILDVAQMLLASVKGEMATKLAPGAGAAAAPAAAPAAKQAEQPVETKAEPEAGDETITEDTVVETADAGPAAKASGGSSLFDDASSMFDEPTAPETAADDQAPAEEAQAAKPASSGGSLFDLGGNAEPEAEAEPTPKAEPASSGGSLFDIAAEEPAAQEPAAPEPAPEPESKPESTPAPTPAPRQEAEVDLGGSLFDIATPAPEPEPEPQAAEPEPEAEAAAVEPAPAPAPAPKASVIPEGGSLFDIAAPEPVAAPEPRAEEPATEPEAQEQSADTGKPDPVALSQAATAAASEEPTDPEPEPEPAQEEKPEAGGAGHQPRTDADIHGSGSLFDL